MLMVWYTKGLSISIQNENEKLIRLGNGWIKFKDKGLNELVYSLNKKTNGLIEKNNMEFFRLSIEPDNVFFEPDSFDCFWDKNNEVITIKLNEIRTKWMSLLGEESQIPATALSLKTALPYIISGDISAIHVGDTIPNLARYLRDLTKKHAKKVGLRQFISEGKPPKALINLTEITEI